MLWRAYVALIVYKIPIALKKIVLIGLLIHLSLSLSAQNTTSRIMVNTGASLDVYFNQLDDYATGITLDGYTKLKIYFNDTIDAVTGNPANTGWQLSVKPDGDLISVFSATSITIDHIDLRLTGTTLSDPSATFDNITLDGSKQKIAEGDGQIAINETITISYDIGKTVPINIVSNERFVVLLEFILEPKP